MLLYTISNVQGSEQKHVVHGGHPTNVLVGRVHLLRRLNFKREFFVPFIPTKYILLVFPTFKPLADNFTISDDTVTTVSSFFAWLAQYSQKSFLVLDLFVCTHSGCVVAVIDCADVLKAIDVLSVLQESTAPCIGNRFVLSFPCDRDAVLSGTIEENYYVIPTCTICAERLEPTLTGYTARTCRCAPEKECRCFLEKSSCVVCQALLRMHRDHTAISCEKCGLTGDPWICMLCGFVGCSRYQKKHARDHFLEEKHFFSMSFVTQQIWDYDSDVFVHRVVVMFDTKTGGTERLQYPDRDNFPGSLEDEMDETFMDKAKKKHINARFDSSVEKSNEDFAQLIKEKLEARRKEYESENQFLAPLSASAAIVNSGKDEREDLAVYNVMQGDAAHNSSHSNWLSLYLANQSLESELYKRRKEEAALANSLSAHEEELRATVKRYVEEEQRIVEKVLDLRETISQIEMNVRLQGRLTAELGGDTAQRVVVTGSDRGNRETKKKQRRH